MDEVKVQMQYIQRERDSGDCIGLLILIREEKVGF